MGKRADQYEDVTLELRGDSEPHWFTGRTRLGNWYFKVWFPDGGIESGHDCDEASVKERARALAEGRAPRRNAPVKVAPGAFARVHASTRSSRYGKLPGGVTYVQPHEFKADDWHRCAHGQQQRLCRSCLEWHCACPGSPKHECRRAA